VARDWRDDRIAELEGRLAKLEALVEELRAERTELRKENAELRRENAELKEKLGKSSRNSSRPPSSDGPAERAKRPRKEPSGRAPGGQPGHDKHERPEVPPEKVSKRVVLRPSRCAKCAARLAGEDPDPHRHQVFELPKIELVVTEYLLHALCCKGCGHVTRATLPQGVPTRIFGPMVVAVCTYLMGVHRLGKRGVSEMLHDLFGLPMSVGAVVDSQQQGSEGLAQPYDEAAREAAAAPVKNADETSWREGKTKAWLWTLVTSKLVVFMIHKSRGHDAAARLLLGAKTLLRDVVFGVLGTDRHGAYNFWPLRQHQFCWSHLKRDFTAIAERPGASGRIGRQLVQETDRMFAWWHRIRDGTLSRARFRVFMRPLRARVEALLLEGSRLGHKNTARTCAKLLKSSEAMWTFVRLEGVEPTNNSAERAVRHGVIYRKLSGGTKSEAGSRFVERILTVHATLRLQGRPILPFLRDACDAHLRGSAPPSLLPSRPMPLRAAA
jgi:transposase